MSIAAVGAVVVGARAAWMAVLVYASTVYLAAPRTAGGSASMWAWPMQPTRVTASFLTAGALLVVAFLVYSAYGARPTVDVD